MESLKKIFDKFKRGPQEIVGLDLQKTGIPAVRLSKDVNGPVVMAVDVLPGMESPGDTDVKAPRPLKLPSRLKAKHAALCVSSRMAVIKLITFPGEFTTEQEDKMIQGLGLEKPENYRISYKIVVEGRGRAESKVVVAALPEDEAALAPRWLPSGTPVPFSIEIYDLAVMSAFLNGSGAGKDRGTGLIHFGVDWSTLGIFNKGILGLVRRFPTGLQTLNAKVMDSLGVDEETAMGIVSDGAFDISQVVSEVVAPLAKQVIVSRDFVERRENCKLDTLFLSGAMAKSNDVVNEIRSAMNLDPQEWNPFEGLNMADGALPGNLAGEPWRFAAALGAGLATFEET